MTNDSKDQANTQGAADGNSEADTASGGAPEAPDTTEDGHRSGGEQRPPGDADLQEPSTEKDPGDEPKAHDAGATEPDHHAVGIGVVGGPQVDLAKTPPTEDGQLSADNGVEQDTLKTLDPDSPPA